MKIALVTTSLLAAAATTGCYYLVGAVGRAVKTGYLVGWTEGTNRQPLTYDGFHERIAKMQRSQYRAEKFNKEWHASSPGKSCAEMPTHMAKGRA